MNDSVSEVAEAESPNRFSVRFPFSVGASNLFDPELAHDWSNGLRRHTRRAGFKNRLAVKDFLEWNVSTSGDLEGVLKVGQRIKRRLHLIERVRRADGLR